MPSEIRALQEHELPAHAELVFLSYRVGRDLPAGSMLTYPDWWLRSIGREPGYRPEQTRVLCRDGRLVASVTCFMRPSRVAGREVPMACIGSVCTHPDWRRQGLVREVLAEAAEWLRQQGIVAAFLFGLEAIYGGSGWRHLSTWNTAARLGPRPGLADGIRERPADPSGDLAVLTALHETFAANLTGPMCRSAAFWRRRVLGERGPWSPPAVVQLLERDGEPVGYYAGQDGRLDEVAWRPDQASAVLAFLLQRWPDRPLVLPLFSTGLAAELRSLAAIAPQADCFKSPGTVTLTETYRGLWRFIADPAGMLPGVHDTESLLALLRQRDYTYWAADRA